MSLKLWDQEVFESLLNNGQFTIVDSGPLCAPISSFKVARDDKHRLVLTTHSNIDSRRDIVRFPDIPSGTVHSLAAEIALSSADLTVTGKGVRPYSCSQDVDSLASGGSRTEHSSIESLESIPADIARVRHLIEWVDCVDTYLYVWPHQLEDRLETASTRKLIGEGNELTLVDKQMRSTVRGCLRLDIAGSQILIAPPRDTNRERPSGVGFILYKKYASESTRRRIRECLSFAFGLPMLYLGHTLLSESLDIIGFRAETPNIIDEDVYSFPALPPAPVGRQFATLIDPTVFSRTVNALFEHYDALNFQHVSWIYWHAMCSPSHTMAGQLGAGIEALQDAYRKLNISAFKTVLLDATNARDLADKFKEIIDKMPIDEPEKIELRKKMANLNSPSQRILNDRFFECLSLEMGTKEKGAWQRRYDAAHGKDAGKNGQIDLIRDNQLLKNMFHRIVFAIAGASDQYIDCYTPKRPIRQLRESVDANDRRFFEG